MKLRHVEITVMNFIILLILYIIEFRAFNFRVSYFFASIKFRDFFKLSTREIK